MRMKPRTMWRFDAFRVNLAVLLLLMLLMLLGESNAVVISSGTKVMAYFLTACPSGWTARNADPYRGRVIKGTTTNFATTKDSAQASVGAGSTHTHGAGWTMRTRIDQKAKVDCQVFTSEKAADDGVNYDVTASTSGASMSSSDAGMPYVLMNLCMYSGADSVTLPPGIVTFLDSTTTCPTGFTQFADANGRFLVFGGASVDLTSAKVSPAAQATASEADIGVHGHTIPSFNYQAINVCASGWSCVTGSEGARGGSASNPTQTYAFNEVSGTSMATSRITIPYVQLIACKVSDATNNNKLPHPDAIFFFDGPSCPATYRESSSRTDAGLPYSGIVGRLVLNRYDSVGTPGQTWGGNQLRYAIGTNVGTTDTGHDSHTHSINIPNYKFPNRYSSCASFGTCPAGSDKCKENYFMNYETYNFNFPTAIENSGTGLLPYRVMRACSPQAPTSAPTNEPTKSPTTSLPTRSPTSSKPTRSPVFKPTTSPTQQPTKSPTYKPSKSPTTSVPSKSPTTPTTLAPTTYAPTSPPVPTQSPSKAPTTSRPSAVPTVSPTTSRPTTSPTKAPVFVNMCTPSEEALFGTYPTWFDKQSSWCAAECRGSLLSGNSVGTLICVNNCQAFKQYSPLCINCFRRFLTCQNDVCQACLVATTGYLTKPCRDCTASKCRADLASCTGFSASVLDLPTSSPISDEEAKPKDSINFVPIIGGVVGGVAALLAGVFVLQRRRTNRRVENGLKQAWADRLFAKENDDEGMVVGGLAALGAGAAADQAYVASPASNGGADMRVPLRTRFSFHGDPTTDELDVGAGIALTGVSRNRQWWVAIDESSQMIGLIPAAYCSEV